MGYEVKRRVDETEDEFIYRICDNKDLIGSWNNVADKLNSELGHSFDESKYRKQYSIAKKMLPAMHVENLSTDLDEKIKELDKARQKLYATKTEYSRQIRHQSRFELFYENVKDAIQYIDVPEFVPDYMCEYDDSNEYVLTIADIHAGARFDVDTNHYSLDECARRFSVLAEHMALYVKEHHVYKLNVMCLGDCIQGMIHLSDLQLNETTVVHATVFVSKLLAQFLNTLSQYCYVEYSHVPSSNHSQTRPLGTKASELASEDVEYVIGNYIKDVLVKNERVTVNLNFGEQFTEISLFNFKSIAFHGHQFKSIQTALKDISFKRRVFYDYLFLAHFHAGQNITSGESAIADTETLICPSFVGTCPYADTLLKGAKPACKVFVFNQKYGHVDDHKIYLT